MILPVPTLLAGVALALAADATALEFQQPRPPQGAVAPKNTSGVGSDRWFPETQKNLGTYFQNEKAQGEFEFKNPNGAEVTLSGFTQSCSCSHAEIRIGDGVWRLEKHPVPNTLYKVVETDGAEHLELAKEILVPAGADGVVKVEMDVNSTNGKREATLDFHTTDNVTPHVKLKFEAVGTSLFQIQPADFNLGKMKWNETREFTFRVRSVIEKDFEITGHDPLPEGFAVEMEKEMNGEFATWVVKGTFGPLESERTGGGTIKLRSSVRGGQPVDLRVHAVVEGPVTLTPGGFLSLGLIRKGEGVKKSLTITPNDDFKLEVTSVKLEGLTVDSDFVTVTSRKEGKAVVVELEVSKDAPVGKLVRGDIIVELNHPAVKQRKILFNGFVR